MILTPMSALVQVMGKASFYLGQDGAGANMKLVVNMVRLLSRLLLQPLECVLSDAAHGFDATRGAAPSSNRGHSQGLENPPRLLSDRHRLDGSSHHARWQSLLQRHDTGPSVSGMASPGGIG